MAATPVSAMNGCETTGHRRLLVIASALGVGNGAVFGLLGRRIPPGQVGSVTGLVGAAGGMGGFLPPIIMGLVFEVTESFAIGLMLLSDIAFVGAIYAAWRLVSTRGQTNASSAGR